MNIAQIKLLDTGYISATTTLASQGQLADSLRAGYTGSAVTSFTLKAGAHSRNKVVKIENKAVVGTLADVNTSQTSTNNPVFNINFRLEKKITTTGFDVNDIIQLYRMDSTRGLKLLYVSAVDDITGYKTLIEVFGAVNTNGVFAEASPTDDEGTVSTTTPYLIGRVRDMKIADSPKGTFWSGSFNFEVTG